MEIDYIFPRRIFSSKKSARTKILTEWMENGFQALLHNGSFIYSLNFIFAKYYQNEIWWNTNLGHFMNLMKWKYN